jgi:hypothetical protein
MADGRKKMTDAEIEAAAVEALRTSLGGPDTDIGQARLRNLEFYNAEAKGELAPPEVMDRSDFVATDVADTVEGMLPQIMRMFVGSGDAVEFEGQGQEGSEQEAKLATAYVNHLFYVRNDGLSVIHDWFKDALLQKVGYVKVWADEDAEDSKQKYEGVTEEQLVMLMQDGWGLAEEPEVDEQGGLNFTVRKESRRKCVKVRAVAPVAMRVDVNARWDDTPAMIGEVIYKRRFQWEEDGYDLTDVGATGDQPSDMESLEMLGEASDSTYAVPHDSHSLLKGAEIYIQLDADADGIAEWLKVCLIEDKLAYYTDGKSAIEQMADHPYVWICPIPRPHSFFGDCPADRAIEPQKLRTRTVRAIEDNMLLTVNGRTYVNTSANVNIDDVLDSRAGGIVRGQGPANMALAPIVQPSLGAPAYQFNEYIASWAENRTGYNRYSAGTDQNALNKTKGGVELLTAKADMRMELMARFFGVGMRKLFAKMLKLAIQHQNVPEMVAINGTFVPINPSEFRNQYHVKINVGLGSGSKEQQAQRIMGLIQILQMGAQAGVVRPQHLAEAIRLYVEANEFKNPERFVDPEPSGMPPNPQAFQQMQQQSQEQMQTLQQQLQQAEQENQQLKLANANKQGEQQLKAAELESKHAIAMQPEAQPEQKDDSLEWAKLEIARYEAETKRMALGFNADQAQAQFALDHAQATHGAMMAEAAHAQRENQQGAE